MQLARGIRKHGFRKWYERELVHSHAHLILTFLCCISLVAALEAASQFTNWRDRLIDGLTVVASIGIGLWALRRFLYLLGHAEFVAAQADCAQCSTYGRLELVTEPVADGPTEVRCKKCGQQWRIDA